MPTPIVMQTTQAPPTPAPRIVTNEGGVTAVVPLPIEMLQAHAAQLVRQLAGLEVQSNYLEHQSEEDGIGQAARAQIDANRANIDVQIAQARADLENVRAQIASRENVPLSRISETGYVMPASPPRQQRTGPDPDMVVGMSMGLLMIIAIPITIAYARRIWRGGRPQPALAKFDEIAPRLERIEQAMDAIAIEVERVSEGQRFVTKILAERPQEMAVAAQGPVSASPDASADGRPILAIGAGPMEPIRKAERQAVRQQMHTPH